MPSGEVFSLRHELRKMNPHLEPITAEKDSPAGTDGFVVVPDKSLLRKSTGEDAMLGPTLKKYRSLFSSFEIRHFYFSARDGELNESVAYILQNSVYEGAFLVLPEQWKQAERESILQVMRQNHLKATLGCAHPASAVSLNKARPACNTLPRQQPLPFSRENFQLIINVLPPNCLDFRERYLQICQSFCLASSTNIVVSVLPESSLDAVTDMMQSLPIWIHQLPHVSTLRDLRKMEAYYRGACEGSASLRTLPVAKKSVSVLKKVATPPVHSIIQQRTEPSSAVEAVGSKDLPVSGLESLRISAGPATSSTIDLLTPPADDLPVEKPEPAFVPRKKISVKEKFRLKKLRQLENQLNCNPGIPKVSSHQALPVRMNATPQVTAPAPAPTPEFNPDKMTNRLFQSKPQFLVSGLFSGRSNLQSTAAAPEFPLKSSKTFFDCLSRVNH